MCVGGGGWGGGGGESSGWQEGGRRFDSLPWLSKDVVYEPHCLVTLPLTMNEKSKWLSSLPILI